jgi:hypothetical protein
VSYAAGECLGDVTGSGREVENGVGQPGRERGDERIRDRLIDGRDRLPLRLPAACSGVPAPTRLFCRLYAATLVNCGRISRP